jgi:hypothetical protein
VIAAALLPLSVSASPTPSPRLDTLLAAPPNGFTELSPATLHGRFDAHDYAASYQSKAADAEDAMRRDGFVDGYGMTWLQKSTGHVLVEFVIAFEGGRGAKSWLDYEEAPDKSHPQFQHSNTIAGIDPYYGVHLVDASAHVVIDGFSFVKGNDMFGVGFVSTKDDVLSQATTQVRSQYDSAPNETIPRAQWPENISQSDANDLAKVLDLARILGVVLILAFIVGVGGLVVGRVRRSRRPRMSPDGNHWWDGKRWIESVNEPPPFAERTADGAYWWDGQYWRPVATAQPPTSGR